jgi:hypothetical protein
MRSLRTLGLCLVVALVVSALGYRFLSASPGPFVEDDSYFYAQIGYRLGTAHRSTFDGIHTTDGYHLLWGAMLGATSQLLAPLTRNKDVHLAAYFTLYLALVFFAAVARGRSLAERALLVAVGVWSAFLMESALVTLLLLTLLPSVIGTRPRDRADDISLLLLPLARIDTAAIALVWLLAPLAERRFREAARMLGFIVAGVVLQLAIMKLAFGHFTSVSSELKAGHVLAIAANLKHNLVGEGSRRALLLFLFFALAAIAAATGEATRRRRMLIALAGPAAFIAAHFAANSDMKSWYGTPILACFIFVAAGSESRRLKQVLAGLAILIAPFVAATRVSHARHTWPTAVASREFVAALQDVVPADAIVFHTDGGGYVGYHSGRHVINGDGLVNSHEYAARLVRKELGDYLYANDVGFIVANFPRQPLAPLLASYGGMTLRGGEPQPLVESRASGQPDNAFWNFRLYRVPR